MVKSFENEIKIWLAKRVVEEVVEVVVVEVVAVVEVVVEVIPSKANNWRKKHNTTGTLSSHKYFFQYF